jgi:hypothetical protein
MDSQWQDFQIDSSIIGRKRLIPNVEPPLERIVHALDSFGALEAKGVNNSTLVQIFNLN